MAWWYIKDRDMITLPFACTTHNTEMKTCTYLIQLILHLHTQFIEWTEHVWRVALQCDAVMASLVM
jgi:predicted transglutaminase-like protease